MDSGAFNFMLLATSQLEGSCKYYGCMQPAADNFNPKATQPIECEFYGCMDRDSDNFELQHTVRQAVMYWFLAHALLTCHTPNILERMTLE